MGLLKKIGELKERYHEEQFKSMEKKTARMEKETPLLAKQAKYTAQQAKLEAARAKLNKAKAQSPSRFAQAKQVLSGGGPSSGGVFSNVGVNNDAFSLGSRDKKKKGPWD